MKIKKIFEPIEKNKNQLKEIRKRKKELINELKLKTKKKE